MDEDCKYVATRTVDHAGRSFEIRAEPLSSQEDLLVSIWEDDKVVRFTLPGGLVASLDLPVTFERGVNFLSPLGSAERAAVESLMDSAEADIRRWII